MKGWKEHFKNLYNVDTEEWVTTNLCDFNGGKEHNCFEGEPISRAKMENKLKKLKTGKAAGKNKVPR